MKVTIDIPDDLYRQVKAKVALEGRRIREVTIELFQNWLDKDELKPTPKTDHGQNQPRPH